MKTVLSNSSAVLHRGSVCRVYGCDEFRMEDNSPSNSHEPHIIINAPVANSPLDSLTGKAVHESD